MATNPTFLQLVNKVLIRVREEVVTSVNSTDYSALVGEWINEAQTSVEEAWTWNSKRDTIVVQTVGDGVSFAYALTGAGPSPLILSVFDDTQDLILRREKWSTMNRVMNVGTQAAIAYPDRWDLNGVDSNGDAVINLYPVPSTSSQILVNYSSYSDDLVDNDDKPAAPWRPIYLMALAMALKDRGEDGGKGPSAADLAAYGALEAAIARDSDGHDDETDWYIE